MSKATNIGTLAEASEVKVLSATVTLTDAQIKALPTGTGALCVAGEAGYTLRFKGATVRTRFAEPYVIAESGTRECQFYYGDEWSTASVEGDVDILTKMFVDGVFDDFEFIPGGTPGTLVDYRTAGDIADQALKFYVYNNNANFTGGDAANEMDVTVYYTKEAT